ncbi:MAG: SusD/RagB family nutrient-binding outer membrane lipoprotein [Bacteroidales bacterium]|nr:SusD/RagB family nutrient-binding outer membrane lipoprotein [Bacteroidales bacterium]
MKIIRIAGIAVLMSAFLFIFDSCTKNFEEINTDPDNPTLDKSAPDMLLTDAIEVLTDRVHEIFTGEEMGNGWVQQHAKVQYTDEDRYIYRTSVVNAAWTSLYANSGMDVQALYNVGVDRQHENYQGVALVLKAYIASLITDLWGPVPYTQAWTGSTNLSPAYDDQETIYRDLMVKLEEANALLDPAGDPISGDILYNGDIMKWKKFCNSLKLRLLLRMSEKDKDFVTTEMKKIVGTPGTYPIFEGNEDNAALQYLGSAPNNHPWNENRKTRDDHRVSITMTDQMWTLSPYVDWRICLYAEPSDNNTFEGIPNGLTSSQAASYNGNGIKNTSKVGVYFTAYPSSPDNPMPPGMLMSFAELKFILAEAAHKTYIDGGDEAAGVYYIEGIVGSYNQFGDALVEAVAHTAGIHGGVPDTWDADSLALDFIANETFGWDAGAAMELIGKQKWAAMYDQGLQSFIEWRRIGYPVLTPAAEGMNDGKIPVRFPYPTDEYARNPSNVNAGTALLGGPDDLNTRVWWDVTP